MLYRYFYCRVLLLLWLNFAGTAQGWISCSNIIDARGWRTPPSSRFQQSKRHNHQANNEQRPPAGRVAQLTGYASSSDYGLYRLALEREGFVVLQDYDDEGVAYYRWNAASGMLQLVDTAAAAAQGNADISNGSIIHDAPKWVPLYSDKENVLVKNGWSFLDTDESEALSAFDVDAANQEGLYQPKWVQEAKQPVKLSSLGYALTSLSANEIQLLASTLNGDLSRQVLLEGATDPPGQKRTHNGCDFSGSIATVEPGLFCCAIGGLPIFSTTDLSAKTVSSGWLSFARPVSDEHVRLIHPADSAAADERIEVVCAKTSCHLGHYFGPGEGYCINASALDFMTLLDSSIAGPVSYRSLEQSCEQTPSVQLIRRFLENSTDNRVAVVLGAGCFWHVETALRRLPGVVSTFTGYAGGSTPSPSYKDVCSGTTGHAEVVQVTFDPLVLDPAVLLDCFFAMHDPTKVRAHGKHAADGQYRSCILLPADSPLEAVAMAAVQECREHLSKEVCTQVRVMDTSQPWFFFAEERHQRHDETRGSSTELSTMIVNKWLEQYGVRNESVWGSSETLSEGIEEARLMI